MDVKWIQIFKVKKVSKENASYKCLSLIMLDSVIGVSKKYYPQTLLEESKYKIKKNKIENLINDDLDTTSSGNDSDSDSDNEIENDESNEKFFWKLILYFNKSPIIAWSL